MGEKDQDQRAESEHPVVDYAFLDIESGDQPLRVIYSLPLFHEIDFVVNEGYRKIPHGGIEVAGLLFGTIAKGEVRIETFRSIECEHAGGPSLNFSERDLTTLEMQIQGSVLEKGLEKFKPVGWFLGHTRGGLELSESEAKQFDRFFREPNNLTVIVKPERFQPTRFGFLARNGNGEMPRDCKSSTVILPLPGRASKAGQLIPSIPAPNPLTSVKKTAPHQVVEKPVLNEEVKSKPVAKAPLDSESIAKKAAELELSSIWKIPPSSEDNQPDDAAQEADELELPEARTVAQQQDRRRLARERARLIEEAFPAPPPLSPSETPRHREVSVVAPVSKSEFFLPPLTPAVQPPISPAFRPAPLPSLPLDATRYVPSAYDRMPAAEAPKTTYDEDSVESSGVFNARSMTAFALAALLGCLVGYVGYLQLPAPVISIDIRPVDKKIIVSWPPEETRNADSASIRLNDGAPVALSPEEKKLGQVAISAAKDFKVEVVAHNLIRDSRGIVLYLRSGTVNSPVVLNDAPPSP
jgi:hypothetical protein